MNRSSTQLVSTADISAVEATRVESGPPSHVRPEASQPNRWARLRSHDGTDEAGFTLAEVLITLVILSVAVVALVSSLMNAIAMSDVHRKQAVTQSMLRNYAESIKSAVAGCQQSGPATGTFSPVYTVPPGYTVTPTVASLQNNPCPTPTKGLTLTAASTDNRSSLSVSIVIVVP